VDWRAARVVYETTNPSATTGVDITTSPKTTYFYRVAVMDTNGLLTLGNELSVTTHPGADYPFVDNGEGGAATWVADAPWALSEEAAASPARAWSDSPGTNYANGITSQSLTLVAPVYLAGTAVSPVLSFNHRYAFGPGDSGNVEPQKCTSESAICWISREFEEYSTMRLTKSFHVRWLNLEAAGFRSSWPLLGTLFGDDNRAATAAHCDPLGR
jgi:hypothetical protein